jgi:apolipoprotein N-acyltransferase
MILPLENPHISRKVLPFIGGIFYAMGFPHTVLPQFFLFSILGMVIFLSSLSFPHLRKQDFRLKSELLSLLFFSLGYCLIGYYWIPHTLKTFGSIPFPFNQILGSLFSLIIAPQFLIFILLHRFIRKFKLKTSSWVSSFSQRNLIYALLLTLLEYYVPQQFPAHLGHPWLTLNPFLGLAPIFGAPIFSFTSYWLVLGILSFLRERVIDFWLMGSLALFIAFNILMPLKQQPWPAAAENQVRFVQANIGNFLKLSSESGKGNSRQEVYQRYFNLSTTELPNKTDLIIWPETAFPQLLASDIMLNFPASTPKLFKETISATGAELLVGGYDRSSQGEPSYKSEYNTAFLFSDSGALKDYYHKMKLIPFGEGLPFGPLNQYLSKLISNISYFAEGKRHTLFKTRNGTPFITLICYEALFSYFLRNYLNELNEAPSMLINITNDSWYGDTSEPYQHLFLTHWRALEFQIPILRMTNTGVTSVLYPDGSESERLGIGEKTYLDMKVSTGHAKPTLFQKYGFWLTFILASGLLLIITLIGKVFSRQKETLL